MKALSIVSLILNVVLLAIIIVPKVRESKADAENIQDWKSWIIENETRSLPLTIQEMDARDIALDSVVLYTDRIPWTGYIVTTWTDKYSQQPEIKYVELKVRPSRGYYANWRSAKYH